MTSSVQEISYTNKKGGSQGKSGKFSKPTPQHFRACQASTKIGATLAHTGKIHTQVVSCLCFVSMERMRQASCCTSSRRKLNFALTWIAFVFGFSKSGNCRTVSLWTKHISWVLAQSCPKNATVTRCRCGTEHIPLVSAHWKLGSSCPPSHWVIRKLVQCEFCTGTTCTPSKLAVAKHTDWL